MRFLIASGCPIATTSLYRCTHLSEQLRALGHETRIVDWFDEHNVDPAAALGCDAFFLYRVPMSSQLARIIESAHAADLPVIFDTDDLVFEPELVSAQRGVARLSPADQELHVEDVRRYLETLLACDAVTTATPFLAELARRRGKTAFVHRNALGNEMQTLSDRLYGKREARERVVIGYGSGTPTHDVDFAEAAPALCQILAQFPIAELWLVGPLEVSRELEAFGGRVRRFPLTNWQDWFERLSQFDIALAPLELDNVFCRAKSEIKFVEAGALGVPVLASRTDPFDKVISDRADGLLAVNQDEWAEQLRWLIEEPEQRAKIGAAARASVLQHYASTVRTAALARILPHLLHARKENVAARA